MTRAELHDMVGRIQVLLRDAGVEVGDRVVAWLPNRPETYAVMLACAGLGAVFASTSPDFGTDGVIDRFGQIEPTVLSRFRTTPTTASATTALVGSTRSFRAAIPSASIVVEPGWLDAVESTPITFVPLPFDTRGTCCSRRAPPASPSASCTAPAVCC